MPKFTLDLTAAAVTRLNAIVGAYNANNGTALTVPEWLLLHIKEVAVGEQLAAAVDGLRRQAEANANAALEDAVKAERDRLIAGVT